MKTLGSLRLKAAVVLMLLAILNSGCVFSDILGRLDTTPTNCDSPTFTVTLTTDLSDGICNSQCSLRDAIQAATDCPGPHTVQLGPQTYTLSGPGDPRGDLKITKDMTIIGQSQDQTIVRGENGWRARIFEVERGATVTISNLTITGGHADLAGSVFAVPAGSPTPYDPGSGGSDSGGGILNWGTLTLGHVTIQGNASPDFGGGLYNGGGTITMNDVILDRNMAADGGGGFANAGLATLNSVSVTNNRAWGYDHDLRCGGGIVNIGGSLSLNGGAVSSNSGKEGGGLCNSRGAQIEVNGLSIFSNQAQENGGGIANFGDLRIDTADIHDNQADQGGGIWMSENPYRAIYNVSGPQQINLNDTTLHNNTAHSSGGGLDVELGTFSIAGSQITDNVAGMGGGAIALGGQTNLGWNPGGSIGLSSIIGNQAGSVSGSGPRSFVPAGDGIYSQTAGNITIVNVTFANNRSDAGNGAIAGFGGNFSLEYVTISENSGGMYLGPYASLHIQRTLIVNNTGWNCDIPAAEPGVIVSEGDNLYQDPGCESWLTASGDLDLSSAGTDPGLAGLTDDHGQQVFPLLPTSPAVDYIADTIAGTCRSHSGTDQRGVSRPQGTKCDVGAYELQLSTQSLSVTLVPLATITPTAPAAQPLLTFTENAFCRKGPGTIYEDVTSFNKGQQAQVDGQNDFSPRWYWVRVPDSTDHCWVSEVAVQTSGPVDAVPVQAAPPTPIPTNTPKPQVLACSQITSQSKCNANPDCEYKAGHCQHK